MIRFAALRPLAADLNWSVIVIDKKLTLILSTDFVDSFGGDSAKDNFSRICISHFFILAKPALAP